MPVRWVELDETLSAGEYTANDALGGRLDFIGALRESGGGGVLQAIVITAPNTNTPIIDLVFFDDVFQATADDAVFTPTDSDMSGKCLGAIQLAVADWITFANNGVATSSSLDHPVELKNSPHSLYAQMVTRTTFTPGAVVYTVKLGFLKD